jgi:photosystem II stability/assembly factor-like uncharacterized protein
LKIFKIYKSLTKFFIYLILLTILSGINFSDNRPSGWFLQPLPIPDDVLDIFFVDSLRGWVVTKGYSGTQDTGYIMHTTNGGYNWTVQKRETQFFNTVQFVDTNNGYVVGGYPASNIQKTSNGGINWVDISTYFGDHLQIYDLSFVNKDTGWICTNNPFDGGVYKTTNGGLSWNQQQFDQNTYKLFFINKDTGWYCTNVSSGKLWRTIDGGNNWNLQYTAPSPITYLFFINQYKGWIRAGVNALATMYTTDGGFSWSNAQGFSTGLGIQFLNENIGFAGSLDLPARIAKSTDGGINWGYQVTPHTSQNLISVLRNDTINAWAGNFMHTTNGGGPIIYTGIKPSGSFVPSFILKQNYPNPFNPSTKIRFEIFKSSYVDLIIYDISGREITKLINNKLYNSSGSYEIYFEPQKYNLSSGVYIYSMKAETDDGREIFIDSKKMLFVK